MGPHAPQVSGSDRAWAQQQLPGWQIWHVDQLQPRGRSWSARPLGATAAVPGCAGLPDLETLAEAVRAYEDHLADHIATTLRELDETPASWTGRREMLQARLAALEDLARTKAQ